jgi:hypothetical protein
MNSQCETTRSVDQKVQSKPHIITCRIRIWKSSAIHTRDEFNRATIGENSEGLAGPSVNVASRGSLFVYPRRSKIDRPYLRSQQWRYESRIDGDQRGNVVLPETIHRKRPSASNSLSSIESLSSEVLNVKPRHASTALLAGEQQCGSVLTILTQLPERFAKTQIPILRAV